MMTKKNLLKNIPDDAIRALTQSKPSDINEDQFSIIRPKCEREWITDFQMRAYCEEQKY